MACYQHHRSARLQLCFLPVCGHETLDLPPNVQFLRRQSTSLRWPLYCGALPMGWLRAGNLFLLRPTQCLGI